MGERAQKFRTHKRYIKTNIHSSLSSTHVGVVSLQKAMTPFQDTVAPD
jgi:hypothetical protein